MSDVLAYAQASDQSLTVSFQENMTVIDSVKRHAIQIKRHLDDLAAMAHKDTDVSEGINSFFAEYLYNSLNFFIESADKLPKESNEKRSGFEVFAAAIEEEVKLLE